jgi:predicted cobalt transporter CbtA
MLRKLVICGLLAGLCGGLLATGFAQFTGEPAIDEAIAFEESQEAGEPGGHSSEPVSRGTQSGIGLLAATVVYGLALGGLFALAFALVYGRVGHASPAQTALWLAAGAFLVVYLVPFIKYPANPPGVGDPETIGNRTLLFVTMVAISVLVAIAAARLRTSLSGRQPPPAATVIAVASYLLIVTAAALALPAVNEIPRDFPATTLWDFRAASLGMQTVLWTTLGGLFAVVAPRVLSGQSIFNVPVPKRRMELP